MKQLIILVILISTLFAEQKEIKYINEISILAGDSENGSKQNIDRSFAYEMQFQYNDLDFPIKPEIAFIYSKNIPIYSSGSTTSYTTIMLNGVYEIPYSKLMTPYVKAGSGYASFTEAPGSPKNVPFLDVGAGAKLHFSKRWALKFEVLSIVGQDHFNLVATGGLNFAFGRKYDAPPPQKVCEECPACEPVVIIQKEPVPLDIEFAFADVKLTEASNESIKVFANDINKEYNLHKHILIIGHTDSRGTRGFNATLALKRANTVSETFIVNGIDPDRITVDTHGEITPIASNDTKEGRKHNRRVTVIIQH